MSGCEQEHPGYDCGGTCAVAKFGGDPSAQVDRLTTITSQLVGDISRLPGVQLDQAGESQLVQLLTDAFETVGHVALDVGSTKLVSPPCIVHDCGYAEPHYHGSDGIYPLDIHT